MKIWCYNINTTKRLEMMFLFVCLECGNVFAEPVHWEETHGLDSPPYEHFSGCPLCYGSYVQAYQCDCCGSWMTDGYIKTDDGKRYCGNCFCNMELGDE